MAPDHDAYGRAFADVYDQWYHDLSDPDEVAAHVVADAAPGPILELGVGTGRLSLGFEAIGRTFVGIDTSWSMLERWSAAASTGGATSAAQASMCELPFASGSFGAVFVAYNTFFNVVSFDDQLACVRECARVLTPGGVLVLEAFVPPAAEPGRVHDLSRSRATTDRVVLIATSDEPSTQTLTGAHLDFSPVGLRVRPWQIRWCSPAQLDSMASDAGFALVSRHAAWDRTPFGTESDRHVSTWRR